MIFRTTAIFILSWLCLLQAQSQPSCIHRHYSTNEGLSHNGIMCMLEDHKGYMWFGTWDGLNRFDGYNFTHYKSRPGDSSQLSNNRIDEIKEDRFGCLWLKTYDERIHRFNRRNEIFQGIPHDIKKFSTLNIRISSIYETRDGEMWLISKNIGCFRVITDSMDLSYQVIHYSSNFDDRYLLPSNNVNFVFEDSQKNLFIGTEKGIVCAVGRNKNAINKFLGKKPFNFTCIAESEGKLFIGTKQGRILIYDERINRLSDVSIDGNAGFNHIIRLTDGRLLLSTTNNGLFAFDLKTGCNEHFSAQNFPQLTDNHINSLYLDKSGMVWIENNSPGVVRFRPGDENFKRFTLKTDEVSPFVYFGNFFKIQEDINGKIWINLKGGGFCCYNREKDQVEYFNNQPDNPSRLFSNLTTSFLSDSKGNLWLSTYSRGIEKISFIQYKFRLNKVSGETHVSVNNVRSVFEDKYRNLWVGTKSGKLYCYDKNRSLKKVFSSQTKGSGQIGFDGLVYSIMQDRDGVLWFGTKGGGVVKASFVGNPDQYHFKTETFKNNPVDPFSLSNDFVYTICQDLNGDMWIGTFGGGINLLEQTNGEVRFRNSTNTYNFPGSDYSKIRDFLTDVKGKIWAGTTNGLLLFTPVKGKPEAVKFNGFQKKAGDIHGIPSNDVHYIFQDHSDSIWIGTFGGGLSKVTSFSEEKGPRFQTFNTANDLPVDIVLAIEEDRRGNLWVSTESGISMFKKELNKFINYSELDGLSKSTFSESCCSKGFNGDIYFGCSDGFYSFNPDHITLDKTAPSLELVSLQLFNRNVRIGEPGSPLTQALSEMKSITLTYNQSVFSIGYAGLDFRNSEKLEYAFYLDGFEKEWNYMGTQRKATYTNLSPGTYTFKVMCAINGLFDSKYVKELKIIILPPWWATWYAYIIYFLLMAGFFFIIRNVSLKIMKLKNKVLVEQTITDMKLRFFTNISHELRTPLTLIISPAEELLKDYSLTTKNKECIEVIDRNARRMLRHVNQLLDFRKIQTGKMRLIVGETEMVAFVRDIYAGFKELASSRRIDFKFGSNAKKIHAWIDKEKMDMVIFNLLSNAFKFTPEGKTIEILVNTLKDKGYYEIIVRDEGCGISGQDMSLLFEPFAISHYSSDLKTKGTGIGLSLVKEIVEMHKGHVFVNSASGSGSIFTVRLQSGKDHFSSEEVIIEGLQKEGYAYPDLVRDVIAAVPEPVLKQQAQKKEAPLILIVEDNNDLRVYLRNKLGEFYNIEEAMDGEEGFAKAQKLLPDLVISDIMMPKMDGIQLTDKLRNDFKTSHIPLILLTAKSSVESMIEGIRYGADAYITKPFNIDFLLTRVSGLLQQRKRIFDKFNLPVKVVELSLDEVVVTDKDEQFLKDVIRIIEDNLSNPEFNVEMIANNVGLGRTTLFKKLKSLTGTPPVEFIRDMRVKRGHQLLGTGNFSVSEVAYQIGFSDAGYFSKCFKEKYGVSPIEFLKTSHSK